VVCWMGFLLTCVLWYLMSRDGMAFVICFPHFNGICNLLPTCETCSTIYKIESLINVMLMRSTRYNNHLPWYKHKELTMKIERMSNLQG
jgi:hypothetical protein